jgi:hypothetical protein
MGATGKVLTDWVGDGKLKKFGVRFVNQVWPTTRSRRRRPSMACASGQPSADFSVVAVNQNDSPSSRNRDRTDRP